MVRVDESWAGDVSLLFFTPSRTDRERWKRMLTLHYTTLHASMIEKATEVGSEVGKSLQKKERPRHAKAKEKRKNKAERGRA